MTCRELLWELFRQWEKDLRTSKRGARNTDHQFGGEWTATKLRLLADYLKAYTTALKHKPSPVTLFHKEYIDAFAGTGYWTQPQEDAESNQDLFPDLAEPATQKLLDGSASLALKTEPHFDSHIFIEKSLHRCKQLEQLKKEFPSLAHTITVLRGEANDEIRKLCARDWRLRRAVLFLDPYGMQVEWATIRAIAETKSIDLWVLFPLGMGLNRLLKRSGEIPSAWKERLNALLGRSDWFDEFYQVEKTPTLFGSEEEHVVKASTETIGRHFIENLKSIFAGVASRPAVLRNSKNSPLYLLCFAAGNPTGAPIAVRIANHLLKKVQ